MFQSPVAPSADFAVDGAEAYGFPPFKGGKITALLQNSVEKYLDRRRRGRSEPGATSPRRMVMRHGGGRGAEAVFRGAEPLCGTAARRRKRAGRGYMAPFARVDTGCPCGAAHTAASQPERNRTPRATPATRFCGRKALNICDKESMFFWPAGFTPEAGVLRYARLRQPFKAETLSVVPCL